MKLEFDNKKWKVIASDDKNFELQELVTNTPKIGANKGVEQETYQFRGYHSSLRSVLTRLAELQIDADKDFPKLFKKLDELKEWIKETVVPAMPKLPQTGKRGRMSSSEDFELTTRK